MIEQARLTDHGAELRDKLIGPDKHGGWGIPYVPSNELIENLSAKSLQLLCDMRNLGKPVGFLKRDGSVDSLVCGIVSRLLHELPIGSVFRIWGINDHREIVSVYSATLGPTGEGNDTWMLVFGEPDKRFYIPPVALEPRDEFDLGLCERLVSFGGAQVGRRYMELVGCRGQGNNMQYVTAAAQIMNPFGKERLRQGGGEGLDAAKKLGLGIACTIHQYPNGIISAAYTTRLKDSNRLFGDSLADKENVPPVPNWVPAISIPFSHMLGRAGHRLSVGLDLNSARPDRVGESGPLLPICIGSPIHPFTGEPYPSEQIAMATDALSLAVATQNNVRPLELSSRINNRDFRVEVR
jgi:hypothetical protein